MARVRNISSAGAVIQGMTRTVKPGEILEVQHAEQTARFRVVWVGIAGTRREKEIGVESLPDEPCIWGLRLERCVQFAGNG
jgi:hypothetical protein